MKGIRTGGVPRVDDRRAREATAQSAATAINFPGFLPRYADIVEQMIAELADPRIARPLSAITQMDVPDSHRGGFDECRKPSAATLL